MPPTPIPDGFGIATIVYTRIADGKQYVVTWGFQNISSSDAFANATSISNFWVAHFTAGITVTDYEFSGCKVLQKRAGAEESGTHVAAVAGSVASNPAPPAVCVGVSKQTLRAGRKYRGRVYLPPALLPAVDVDQGGVINPAHVATLSGAAVGFLGDMTTGNVPLVLLHKDLSTPTPIATLEVRGNARTQRRRQALA